MALACGTAPPSGLILGDWELDRVSVSVSFPWRCAWRGEVLAGGGGGDRVVFLASLNPPPPSSRIATTRLSRNTTTLSLPNAETSSHPKKNIRVVEDMLASREAPEEKGDGAQENE